MKGQPKTALNRGPIVGVMGSGSEGHIDRAAPLGRWLAESGVHLLTGGGGGVMVAVSESFHSVSQRTGSVIGIIPWDEDAGKPREGYPNPWVEIPIYTHLPLSGGRGKEPLSRNHINVLSSDVIVALPGDMGTASEVTLAVDYRCPIVAFVDSKDQIPGLSSEVPVEPNFEAVRAFVGGVLRTLGDYHDRHSGRSR